jgi:hypothetical protein
LQATYFACLFSGKLERFGPNFQTHIGHFPMRKMAHADEPHDKCSATSDGLETQLARHCLLARLAGVLLSYGVSDRDWADRKPSIRLKLWRIAEMP